MALLIRVGTCAWADHTGFYPPHTAPAAKLAYYAQHFPLVEVDSTFYHPPSARNCALWAERTPDAFCFHVKAYRTLTWHDRNSIPSPIDLAVLAQDFAVAVAPLEAAGKLGALHFQFPPWFQRTPRALDYLASLRSALPDHLLAIEFRHRSWFQDGGRTAETLDFLREHALVHTVCDEPQAGSGTVPAVMATTHPRLAIVRLHGRNAQTWYAPARTTGERFKYRYSPEELRSWVEPARALEAQAGDVHLLLNNNHEDSAVRNASDLASLLGLGYPDPWGGTLL